LLTEVALGEYVDKGQRLGTVTDPIQNKREVLKASIRGRLLGMAVNQVVMPGFAAFHIGRVADEQEAIRSTATSGEQAETEHSEDTAGYGDEDELFDPSPVSDEPEPEEPVDTDETPDFQPEDQAPALDEILMPDFSWLEEIEWIEAFDCIQPPLSECRDEVGQDRIPNQSKQLHQRRR
jgi:hypothetical protein